MNITRKKYLAFFIISIILYIISGILTFTGLDYGVILATLSVLFLAIGLYLTLKEKSNFFKKVVKI